MEKIKMEIVVSLSASILILSMLASIPIGSSGVEMEPTQYGPRAPRLEIYFYPDPDTLFQALVSSQIDLMDYPLTRYQYEEATSNPDIILAPNTDLDIIKVDLNNNYTISDYPASTNPLYFRDFRRAIAYLIDKNWIIANILESFGSRIDAPVAYPQTEVWANASVITYDWNHNGVIEPSEDNYPYKYDPNAAATILAQMGFSDTDGNGYLNYPNDPSLWGNAAGIDTTEMPLKLCIPSYDAHRRDAGRYLYGQLEGDPTQANDSILARQAAWTLYGKQGGDFDTTDHTWEQPYSVLAPIVFRDHNYHIYWSWFEIGPEPPDFEYYTYHDYFDYPNGPNYVTGKNASNLPNYPLLNQYLEEMWYAQTLNDAMEAAERAQGFIIENCINIPLWSTNSYYAYRNLAGVVNMKGVGPYNIYTLMNAYRTDDSNQPIRIGIWPPPSSMNPLYVDSYDQRLLLPLQDEGGVSNPYNLAKDQPWQTRDWKVDEWYDPEDGLNKTRLTIWLNPNIVWIEPGTGSVIAPLSGEDIELSMWYYYQTIDSPYSDYYALKEIWLYIIIENSSLIEVNINLDVNQPLQMAIEGWKMIIDRVCKWIEGPAVTSEHRSWNDLDSNKSRYLPLPDEGIGAPVKVISVLKNGNSVSAKIRKVPGKRGTGIYVLPPTEYHPGDDIEVFYLAKAEAYGFFPCGLTWQETMISKGPYYLVDFVEGVGGHAFYNANRHYFMPTPPLGEVDWRWYWQGTTKPLSGYFKIDILDVVKATSSYGSSGREIPSQNWFPGADLVVSGDGKPGKIDILDVVKITSQYGKTFGFQP
jgi:hypothetical protein